ncbi:MAG: dUTP diphosphatase [Lentisphaeria bacterium]
MLQKIKFRMEENCQDLQPRKAHSDDAAYDLFSNISTDIPPWTRTLLPTGLYLELPDGFEAQVRPRSGLALKKGITILNSPGTIDAGYRGEVGVIAFNSSEETVYIKRGDRIAQMVIQKLSDIELVEADTLADSHRGEGGFGSSG